MAHMKAQLVLCHLATSGHPHVTPTMRQVSWEERHLRHFLSEGIPFLAVHRTG